MELILATADGRELKVMDHDIDYQIGTENNFEMIVNVSNWDKEITFDRLLYVPGTEYGGIIKDIETSTSEEKIFVRGYTWRGYLAHKIISPPSGADYLIVSGELNSVIRNVLNNALGSLFRVSDINTGITVSYQFNRYVTFIDGISAMLRTKGYKLQIRYIQTALSGYVELAAVPINSYGDASFISQDYKLDFATENNQMGINHLICLGQGELKERYVIHLYADAEGNISKTKTFTGLNEIIDVYENTSAENDQLEEYATEHFKELLSYKKLDVFFAGMNDDYLNIGDTLTGRDYITGVTVTKPVEQKIVTRKDGIVSVQYKVEGEI